jgi:hypothetical protein
VRGEQAVEIAAMAVGPIHHGRDDRRQGLRHDRISYATKYRHLVIEDLA